MRSKIIFSFLLIFSAILFLACSSSSSSDQNKEENGVLVPLAVGNSWTYEINTEFDTATTKLAITGTRTINNENYFTVEVIIWTEVKHIMPPQC